MGLRKKIRRKMKNANLKNFKRGKERLIENTPDTVKYLGAPLYAAGRVSLEAAEVFGTTVAAVRPVVAQRGKGKGPLTAGKAAAAGAAGSVGFFGAAIKTVVGAGKATVDALPKPVAKVVAPAAGFVAGVVAVPVAARYVLPGAAARTAAEAVKAPIAAAIPNGTQERELRGTESGAPSVRAADDSIPVDDAGETAVPSTDANTGTRTSTVAAGGAAPLDSGDAKRRSRKPRSSDKPSRTRTVRSRSSAKPRRRRGRSTVAPADSSGSRRSSRGRNRSGLRGVSLEALKALEAKGWEVTLSPR